MQSHPKQQCHLHDCFYHRPASEDDIVGLDWEDWEDWEDREDWWSVDW